MKNIVLIGLMGCGKTTIAKELTHILHRPVIDIDEYIEEKYEMKIKDMFLISEDYFREKETICCKEISLKDHFIVSTGGGIVKNKENIDALRNNGIIIYIDRPVEHILKDIDINHRPLLKDGPEKLYDLYQQRHKLYLDACDVHLKNDGTLEEIIEKIRKVVY